MNLKIFAIASLLAISAVVACQTETEINKSDQQGRKQGHWIKKYSDGIMIYDGFFKDDHPVGEFKRYYEDHSLKSLLIYSDDGNEGNCDYLSSKWQYIIKREICKPDERGKMAILFCFY